MTGYQQCSYCVMDNKSDSTIRFDKEGRCNYCRDVEKRLKISYFPKESDKIDLIVEKIKADCKNDKYDCIVGVSGGIDSSYILYLGYRYGLRMLAVHIDDGLDNPIAVKNLERLIAKTGADYVTVKPDRKEYADVIYSMLKASVSTLANGQDNLIFKALHDYCETMNIKYSLDGQNLAHESILERGNGVNANDGKYIKAIQKRFGRYKIEKLEFSSLMDRYLRNYRSKVQHVRPLNFIDYNLERALAELNEFCGFEYYGGKHYECILTRYMQCYYLPKKFGIDKRKSHFSSLILSGQMTRDEAIKRLGEPLYSSEELLLEDEKILAEYMNITVEELRRCVDLPPVEAKRYPHSIINYLAPVARKFRSLFE